MVKVNENMFYCMKKQNCNILNAFFNILTNYFNEILIIEISLMGLSDFSIVLTCEIDLATEAPWITLPKSVCLSSSQFLK